jgi:TonB family protein
LADPAAAEETDDDDIRRRSRWRFASFFNRVKRQLREHWHPAPSYQAQALADPSSRLCAELAVVLTREGDLVRTKVLRSAGVQQFDEDAMAAFREAAPFLNPPRQMVGADGVIRFKFGFLFDGSPPAKGGRDGGAGDVLAVDPADGGRP